MKKYLFIITFLIALPFVVTASFGDSTTYVGKLKAGDGEFRTDANFDFPEDITVDSNGNFYLADTFNNVIRKIDTNGTVSTAVGAGGYGDLNSTGAKTRFSHPGGVAVDDSGNVYIADSGNGKIKKYNGSKTTTLKSGLGRPEGIFYRGGKIYFTDYETGRLYSMNTNGGGEQTITSSLNGPKKIYVRTDGKYAYVTNALDYTVVRIKIDGGYTSVIAGMSGTSGKTNGACLASSFKNLWGITIMEGASLDEDDIYITDGTGDPGNIVDRDTFIQNTADAGKVRVIDLNGSDVPEGAVESQSSLASTVCETYLLLKDSDDFAVNYPNSITSYNDYLYVAITGISNVSKLSPTDFTDVEIWAGKDRFHNKNGLNGLPGRPKDIVITRDKSKIYYSENNQIKKIITNRKRIKHVVGNTVDNYQKNDDKGWAKTNGRFSDALSIALSKNERKLFVVDRNNNRIREVDIASRTVYYLTGAGEVNSGGGTSNGYQEGTSCANQFENGVVGCAYFSRPGGIVVDRDGKYGYVVDTGNHVVRRVTLRGKNKGKTKLIAGNPGQRGFKNGTRKKSRFNVPISITIDSKSKNLYIADRNNHAIRKVRIRDGKVTTLVGDPDKAGYLDGKFSDAILNLPVEVYYNKGNVYFSEAGTHMVRVADRSVRAVKLVAGDGNRGYSNGDRDNTQFDNPVGIVRKGNNLLVADSQNDLIRKLDLGNGMDIPYTDPVAEVTSISPASNKLSDTYTDTKALQVFGNKFRHGAIAYFGIHKANQTYVNSENEISVVIPFGHLEPGYYQIRVENTDGQSGYLLRGYSVSDESGNVPEVDHWAN
ncbi:MAG: hypothetical protein Q8P90_03980 [bacterium]|nr:hypothetical protein [bacterium]